MAPSPPQSPANSPQSPRPDQIVQQCTPWAPQRQRRHVRHRTPLHDIALRQQRFNEELNANFPCNSRCIPHEG